MHVMHQALWIGLAGFVGAICRFGVSAVVAATMPRGFPYGTLVVNLTGCVLIGFALTLLRDRAVSDITRLTLAVGFLGAYTTFSALAFELYDALRAGRYAVAGVYVALSIGLGLLAVWSGVQLAHRFER